MKEEQKKRKEKYLFTLYKLIGNFAHPSAIWTHTFDLWKKILLLASFLSRRSFRWRLSLDTRVFPSLACKNIVGTASDFKILFGFSVSWTRASWKQSGVKCSLHTNVCFSFRWFSLRIFWSQTSFDSSLGKLWYVILVPFVYHQPFVQIGTMQWGISKFLSDTKALGRNFWLPPKEHLKAVEALKWRNTWDTAEYKRLQKKQRCRRPTFNLTRFQQLLSRIRIRVTTKNFADELFVVRPLISI